MDIEQLHETAMDLAEDAERAKRRGNIEDAQRWFSEAFELEAQAAQQVAFGDEPTRSILHKSAAVLALDAGFNREAEKLILAALLGEPPFEIAEELRDLLERANFERHLLVRGETLNEGQLQLTMLGNAVGVGVALTNVVIQKVRDFEALIYRTVERMSNQPFRESGRIKKQIADDFSVYMSAPRAGSFAITLQLGTSKQMSFEGYSRTDEIIDELVQCLALLQNNEEADLKGKIRNAAYYRNFVALGKKVAPDGVDISMVGITTSTQKTLQLTRKQEQIPIIPKDEQSNQSETTQEVKVEGTLRFADSVKETKIKIIDKKNKTYTIIVPEGLMNDIVRPLWDFPVIVTGKKLKGKTLLLSDIGLAPDPDNMETQEDS